MRWLIGMPLFALLACSGACGEVVQQDPEARFEAAEVAPPPAAEAAIAIAMQFYAERTGVAMPIASVRWWGGEWMLDDAGQRFAGITFACSDIWVWMPPSRHVTETALAHELAHCAKTTAYNDADSSHADPTWWGITPAPDGYVTQAVDAMQSAGL